MRTSLARQTKAAGLPDGDASVYCPSCGQQITVPGHFCAACGARLAGVRPAAGDDPEQVLCCCGPMGIGVSFARPGFGWWSLHDPRHHQPAAWSRSCTMAWAVR